MFTEQIQVTSDLPCPGIVLHYLQEGQKMGCKRAGQMFGGLDHATALHWKGNINFILNRQKFSTPEKEAVLMFGRLAVIAATPMYYAAGITRPNAERRK